MLVIKESPTAIFSSKKLGDSILIEPPLFCNNFIARSLAKYSVVKLPEELLEDLNTQDKNILSSSFDVNAPMKNIFLRPLYKNIDQLLQSSIEKLRNNYTVLSSPAGAALLIEYCVTNNIEVDFDINVEVDEETLFNSFVEIKTRTFCPIELERLVKLFMIFYGKELTRDEVSTISEMQLLLTSMDQKEIPLENLKIEKMKEVVSSMEERLHLSFSPNNLFNKILEILLNIDSLLERGYHFAKVNNFNVFIHTDETKEFYKETFKKYLG